MTKEQPGPEALAGSAVSFLDEMSADVAELHLTRVTLEQRVHDRLSRRGGRCDLFARHSSRADAECVDPDEVRPVGLDRLAQM